MRKEFLLVSMPKLILAVVLIVCIGAAIGLTGYVLMKSRISMSSEVKSFKSPNNKRNAILKVDVNKKYFFVLDGKKSKKYDYISNHALFSPNSEHFMFVANSGCVWKNTGGDFAQNLCVGGKSFIVFDNYEGEKYDEISGNFVFSSDSQHFAYKVANDCGWKESEKFTGSVPDFGKSYDCVGGKRFFVLNDKEQRKYNDVFNFVFSSDSQRFAYGVGPKSSIYFDDGDEQGSFIVLDDKELKKYSGVDSLTFSSDGKHFVYRAMKDNKTFFVLGDKELKKYGEVTNFIFSPDSEHFTYLVKEKKETESKKLTFYENFVVIDEKEESEKYDFVQNLSFSPDSKFITYDALMREDALHNDKFKIVEPVKTDHF